MYHDCRQISTSNVCLLNPQLKKWFQHLLDLCNKGKGKSTLTVAEAVYSWQRNRPPCACTSTHYFTCTQKLWRSVPFLYSLCWHCAASSRICVFMLLQLLLQIGQLSGSLQCHRIERRKTIVLEARAVRTNAWLTCHVQRIGSLRSWIHGETLPQCQYQQDVV